MPAFRRVEPHLAGPNALGILVPPGLKTVVILRPRGLDWDLLPARWEGEPALPPVFAQFNADEAAHVARRLPLALEQGVAAGKNPVETFGNPLAGQFQVWLHTRDFVWIVCRRMPGQTYRPLLFTARRDRERSADIAALFLSGAGRQSRILL